MTKMVGSWIRMESSGRLGGGMPVVVPEELFVSVLSSVEGRGGGGSFRSLGMSPSVAVAVAVTPGPGSSSTVRLILMMSKQDGGVLVLIQRFW